MQPDHLFEQVESKPLTLAQRTACLSTAKYTLVLAGAGTGKTSTLVGRIAYLCECLQVKPKDILVLTFAADASKEVYHRLQRCQLKVFDPEVKTFHALALSLLKKHDNHLSLSPLVNDEAARKTFINQYVTQLVQTDQEYSHLVLSYFYLYSHELFFAEQFEPIQQYQQKNKFTLWQTLNQEYADNSAEYLVANTLALLDIPYIYRHYYPQAAFIKKYHPYCPCFYLPKHDLYIELIDERMDLLVLNKIKNIHQQYGTRCLFLKAEDYQSFKYIKQILEQSLNTGFSIDYVSNSKKIIGTYAYDQFLHVLYQGFSHYLSSTPVFKAQWSQQFESNALALLDINIKALNNGHYLQLIEQLVKPIVQYYEQWLKKNSYIDFANMVALATDYLNANPHVVPYKHILVDEFQDLAQERFLFIRALLNQQNASLFVLGDDWQSIYRFTGSDIAYTSQFKQYFPSAQYYALDQTFRFNNQIGLVAETFVLKNQAQSSKKMRSLKQVSQACVSLAKQESFTDLLIYLNNQQHNQNNKVAKKSVFILARFHHLLPSNDVLEQLNTDLAFLHIEKSTVHAAKGKEADLVLVLGVNAGLEGFPSDKLSEPFVESFLPNSDEYAYAEERRLFYVAITRAKDHVYLLYDQANPSVFIRELSNGEYFINTWQKNEIKTSPLQRCKSMLGAVLNLQAKQ